MIYRGIVKDGVVVIEEGVTLPDGMQVRIEPCDPVESPQSEGRTLAEQFSDVIGTVPDLPSDMAEQHDHYLHGSPKR
ncbi:MAG: hypothetical protein ACYC6N_03740 [Pirellulaceae bacterium]